MTSENSFSFFTTETAVLRVFRGTAQLTEQVECGSPHGLSPKTLNQSNRTDAHSVQAIPGHTGTFRAGSGASPQQMTDTSALFLVPSTTALTWARGEQ